MHSRAGLGAWVIGKATPATKDMEAAQNIDGSISGNRYN